MNSFATTTSDLVLRSDASQKGLGDAYLKVRLDAQTSAVLLMKQVQELLILPTNRLTPMPNMPAWVMGLTSRRSRILWVIDLSLLLGLQPFKLHTHENNVAILRPGNVSFGAFVQHLEGITWLLPDRIQPLPNHIPSKLRPYVKGCVLSDEILLVLDVETIVQASITREY